MATTLSLSIHRQMSKDPCHGSATGLSYTEHVQRRGNCCLSYLFQESGILCVLGGPAVDYDQNRQWQRPMDIMTSCGSLRIAKNYFIIRTLLTLHQYYITKFLRGSIFTNRWCLPLHGFNSTDVCPLCTAIVLISRVCMCRWSPWNSYTIVMELHSTFKAN